MEKDALKAPSTFGWLNITQFLGVLNDNIFKLLVVTFVIGLWGLDSANTVMSYGSLVFTLPFLFFLVPAGRLADRFSKRDIIVALKLLEILIMAAGALAFLLKWEIALFIVLFFMTTQSAFFSPSKYGIVPELVQTHRLSHANGLLEAFTYIASVLSAVIVPPLLWMFEDNYSLAACVCICIAIVGFLASLLIRKTSPVGVQTQGSVLFFMDLLRTLFGLRRQKDLLLAVFASAFFLLIGSFVLLNIVPFGIHQMGFDEKQTLYLYLPGSVGIAAGSLLAGRLSGRRVELGLVPAGAAGLTLSMVCLGIFPPNLYSVLIVIFFAGASSGFLLVPLNAFIQLKSPIESRGRIIAAAGFLSWLGIFGGAGLLYLLGTALKMTAAQAFVVVSILAAILTVVAFITLTASGLRFFVRILVRLFYRFRYEGWQNIPADEGVLFVSNHSAWIDAVLLIACLDKPVRFIMDKEYYDHWFLNPFCGLLNVIPVSSQAHPRDILQALNTAAKALRQGQNVCIFPEGAMTRTGMMMPFKTGLKWLLRKSKCRVVPVYIGGTWGSIFSCYYGKPISTYPRRFRMPVSVLFGQPVEHQTPITKIRQKVCELSCEYYKNLDGANLSLARHFVETARRHRYRHCISDSSGRSLNYEEALVSSLALAKRIKKISADQQTIGIMLPPSVGAVLSNIAVTMLGKTAVNFNYTVSDQLISSAVNQTKIETIITSRKFIAEANKYSVQEKHVFLEDIAARIGTSEKISAHLKSVFAPSGLLVKNSRNCGDKIATIIFTSGSGGEPKGVKLSHRNIYANIRALQSVFRFNKDDNLCAILPFFHSFGFTCSLWVPLLAGVSAGYAANPLDFKMVGRVARENKSTVLFAVPTFLVNYARKIEKKDFANLRIVVVGAEKLKETIADSFEQKFGIRPLEGYGATELSPVVSLNLPDAQSSGVYQIGHIEGTAGHPIPGIAIKIVDINTEEELFTNQPGLLFVKGPNVMLGYLNNPQETQCVIIDGWYNTGDIATLDDNGFITISDRLSRFSKIAGEMVPHWAIEEILHKALGSDEHIVSVVGIPDEKKGEELVVFYLGGAADPDKLHQIITESTLPNLYKPRRENYVPIAKMPTLGSGKLDIAQLKKLALKLLPRFVSRNQ